ncbi:MAG: hypothetical protein Q9209_004439 [Squamulea sp. 1 TL-2023]
MAIDYSKKKNAELEELLKARSLPHTGKKAELISRLQQSDKDAAAAKPTTTSKPDIPPEDEIDWDDDALAADVSTTKTTATDIPAKSATTPSAAVAIAAGGKGQAPNPTAVPNQIPTDEPFKKEDLTVKPPGEPIPEIKTANATTKPTEDAPPAKPPTDYTAHIPLTTTEEELEKRRKRAERFNITADAEATKKLERAKKFGGADPEKPVVKGLDEALPERRKRGRGADDDGGRGGKRGRGGRRNDRSRSKSKGRGGEGKKTGVVVNGKGGEKGDGDAKAAQRKKDAEAAEARKKRFAATG